jgi:hypothetical protein
MIAQGCARRAAADAKRERAVRLGLATAGRIALAWGAAAADRSEIAIPSDRVYPESLSSSSDGTAQPFKPGDDLHPTGCL